MEVRVKRVPGERKGGSIFVSEDNFIYHHCKTTHNNARRYYRCRLYKSAKCPARLREAQGIFKVTSGPHSHYPEPEEVARIAFLNAVTYQAKKHSAPAKKVYENAVAEMPGTGIPFGSALLRRIQRRRKEELVRASNGLPMNRLNANQLDNMSDTDIPIKIEPNCEIEFDVDGSDIYDPLNIESNAELDSYEQDADNHLDVDETNIWLEEESDRGEEPETEAESDDDEWPVV